MRRRQHDLPDSSHRLPPERALQLQFKRIDVRPRVPQPPEQCLGLEWLRLSHAVE